MNKILLSALCMCIYRTYPRGGEGGGGGGDINNSLLYQSISPHSYLLQTQPAQKTKSCHLGHGLAPAPGPAPAL